ncbi:hypothetical protein pmac_cds_613 [Pandoravirus macleodensis]|uniref:Uncharacterized protein n=1 Tax=Pandoravirus macleodensis TaxID=2107707 RepID=A0A2U7UH05_9VIRU|nr:hypothetical protein pmac_cds_613 [Pandoravirus macleodensis]AVK77301.1 hypothetical protein pmac_cds_613 [Pandoravirus macleodensis]
MSAIYAYHGKPSSVLLHRIAARVDSLRACSTCDKMAVYYVDMSNGDYCHACDDCIAKADYAARHCDYNYCPMCRPKMAEEHGRRGATRLGPAKCCLQ